MSFLSNIIDSLSGANQAASNTGQYYSDAMQKIQNGVTGPLGQGFVADQNAALAPQFKQQDTNLTDQLAAMGITGSGAGKNDFVNLAGNQSATLAGADAPLYSQGMGAFDSTATQGAGAQNAAYQNAVQQFYNTLQAAGSAAAGVPNFGGGGGASNPYVAGPNNEAVGPLNDANAYNPYGANIGGD